MQTNIGKHIRGSIPKCKLAKEFLEVAKKQFETSDKAFVSTPMSKLSSIKYNRFPKMQEHILEMSNIATH